MNGEALVEFLEIASLHQTMRVLEDHSYQTRARVTGWH